jgi:DNA polymerase-3 subunit gamma/tau
VPEAALQDEESDAESLPRLAQAISPEDVQLYYQIALGGRRDLAMAPEPRMGFEMTLLRMLAFRPDAASAHSDTNAASNRRTADLDAAAGRPGAADAAAVSAAPLPSTQIRDTASVKAPSVNAPSVNAPGVKAPGVKAPNVRLTSFDANNWPAVVEAATLSGMVRQFALNCVPTRFENDVLVLQIDQAAADRRTRPIEDKLVQGLSKYLGRDVRITFEAAEPDLATPARQRALAEREKADRAAAAFEADPAVKGLRERFGADIDAASVKPVN